YRQGKPMRPDVATAFDQLAAGARRAGISLVINSAYRSDAEQAALFAAHPDPRWVTPPGKSLHRCATELDLGPPVAYGWLGAHAHLMSDVLREFGAVSLALAAYNAGPGPVAACHCVPSIPETQAYVARILGLMGAAGELTAPALEVRLVD